MLSKFITWVLIIANTTLSVGCMNYYKVTSPKNPDANTIIDLQDQKKIIFVHYKDTMLVINSIKVNDNNITGKIAEMVWLTKYFQTDNTSKVNRYLKNDKVDESWVLNEVHLHINSYTDLGNSEIMFPLSAVSSLQVYDKATGATVASWVFGFIGGSLGFFVLIYIIAAMQFAQNFDLNPIQFNK